MPLDLRWKNPAGKTPDQLYLWGQDTIRELRKGSDAPWPGFLQSGMGAIARTWLSKERDIVSVKDFGAQGDGSTDDSSAFQAAVNRAIAISGKVIVPATSAGYKINTPINATNINGLTIEGDNGNVPAFGLANTPPTFGSLILANTGTGKPWLDGTGSNSIVLRNLTMKAIGQSTPSTIGVIFGTSNGSQNGNPGGSDCSMENVAIYLTNAAGSCPVYGYNINLSHFLNVWTLGQYGLVFTTANFLSVVPPYATFGSGINSDGICTVNCGLLGYGPQPVLYMEGANNHDHLQLYVNTINGGVGFTGTSYPIYMKNCTDVRMKVEEDFWPSVLEVDGACSRLDISGTAFPNATPVANGVSAIMLINGTSLIESNFDIKLISGALPNNNFFYGSIGGASPPLTILRNCRFQFDTTISPNIGFFNATNANAVPFQNLNFIGDSDTPTISWNVAGAAAPADKIRYYVNGTSPVQTYTPTVGVQSGTLTTASATGRYKRYGHLVWIEIIVTITTNGTGAGFVTATLPGNITANSTSILHGRENGISGKALQAYLGTGTSFFQIYNYDNTYPGANGASLIFSGWFEANT